MTSAEPGLWEEPSKKIFLILPLNSWSTWVKPITSLGLKFFVKEESEKVGLKLNIQKSKVMSSGPITS